MFVSLTPPALLTALTLLFAGPASAQQISFSVDWTGPTRSVPDSGGSVPITDGDILTVTRSGIPLMPLVPGSLMPPTIQISGGATGLGIPTHAMCVGMAPGVLCPIEVDALSFGFDPPFGDQIDPNSRWVFSVDRFAVGVAPAALAPNVASESPVGDASTDVFIDLGFLPLPPMPPGTGGANTGLVDGDGRRSLATLFAYPGTGLIEPSIPGMIPNPGDDLDALDLDEEFDKLLGPFGTYPVWFSLDSGFVDPRTGVANTGTAVAQGAGYVGGDVLFSPVAGGPPAIYAPAALLGLDIVPFAGPDSDDLDALILFENGQFGFQASQIPFDWLGGGHDMVLFSVREGSAVIGMQDSIFGAPIMPGDILTPPLSGSPISPFPGIFVPAEALGLEVSFVRGGFAQFGDDLDALDLREVKSLLQAEYCYGDGGIIPGCTNCPCGNNMPPGTQAGCMNAAGTGCRLFASGLACVSNDSLQFDVTGMAPSSFGLLFAGDNRLPNVGFCPPGSGIAQPIQDGLRCMGQNLIRHGVRGSDATGTNTSPWAGPVGGLIAQGGYVAGQTRQWQVFYRDVVTPMCTTGIMTSSAVQVTFTP